MQNEINNKLRAFKYKIDCARLAIGDKNLDFDKIGIYDFKLTDQDYIEIKVYDNTEKDIKYFNRAKEKRKTRRLINEHYKEIEKDRE